MTIPDVVVHALVVVPGILGLIYATFEFWAIASIVVSADSEKASLTSAEGGDKSGSLQKMVEISGYIANGASAFLFESYKYMAVYIVIAGSIVFLLVGKPASAAFAVGALASIISGWIGMKTATICNVRTTFESIHSLKRGYTVAIRGGAVMGTSLVALGTLVMYATICSLRILFGTKSQELYESLAGFGLGASSIALFGRVAGGIYTKAADVGADLAGKNEWGLNEDDPRNPACIADNVGDNVGDVAGMGSDLFGSFAESTCAALVITAASASIEVEGAKNTMGIDQDFGAMMFPLMLTTISIPVGIVSLLLSRVLFDVSDDVKPSVERSLKGILVISTVLQTPATIALAVWALPPKFRVDDERVISPMMCSTCVCAGLWSGLMIGFVTEYFTSHSFRPVREVAEADDVSAATGIIFGLALGYKSCVVPCFCLAGTAALAHTLCGMYGIALSALGMLGTLVCALAIDVYGPISDNAGGIAEIAGLDEHVRERTDCLDAAGNTTAAVGKGFAIGSAALVSLALFGAYTVRAGIGSVDILSPWTFTGLMIGSMLPFWFSAMTMRSVGEAANDMVRECNRQFPLIMEGKAPEYDHCVQISTRASLREMLAPGALVCLSPIVVGVLFGKLATAGLLTGALMTGVMLAVSMSNSGGAWDNAKKYIEAGGLGEGKGKRSNPHKNAVIGDTVGDPMKDTSGPSLNIVVKLSAIVSLVFAAFIADCSNPVGGPKWLSAGMLTTTKPLF